MATSSRSAAASTDEQFEAAWERFFGALRRAKGRAARQDPSELSLPQYQLISALGDLSEARIGELAEAGGVAPPTATRMLDCLERDGIVERSPAPEDRRAVVVTLTSKGRKLLQRKRAAVARKRRALFESLSPEEREQAIALMDRLAEAIDEL